MKVLIANFITKGNRYLIDLQKGLESYADVVWDYEEFWKCENDYDIVHIHWPESFYPMRFKIIFGLQIFFQSNYLIKLKIV